MMITKNVLMQDLNAVYLQLALCYYCRDYAKNFFV